MSEFGIRWHRWRDVWVVVARGDLDVEAAVQLGRQIARLQRASGVFVDLWDVTFFDPLGARVLEGAKQRADGPGWDFAVIARRDGPVAEEIEAAGLADLLQVFPTKHDARAALRPR
jgi:anti-anti-sigma factor